jgi:hypothetical protein
MGARKVGFSDGTEETYDSLLVATGGKPGVPPSLKKELAAIVIFDSLSDAVRIRERMEQEGTVVVYGPGYLAIEACRALRKAKREVIWIKPDLPCGTGEYPSGKGTISCTCGTTKEKRASPSPGTGRRFPARRLWLPPNASLPWRFWPAAA